MTKAFQKQGYRESPNFSHNGFIEPKKNKMVWECDRDDVWNVGETT